MSEQKIKENIVDINVCQEMENSFLEYAYSVIYSRALPDARDGLKPVQRRILFQMKQMGLMPDKGHVKSAGVVGDVMGKLHPHGDSAIYDALVRMAQSFSLRLPLIDGHGNFGTLDDGPAAYRYTEARLAPAALELTASLDEDVVDFVPNYDNRYTQPVVLPAAFPNLLVNGASGIAVGMATNIAPHNLGECINACCYLLDNPDASVDELMRFIPGPDLPEGAVIVGLDGVRQAYETGRGSFKIRASVKIERISARKQAIVVTELPYMVGPERVIEKIKDAVSSRKLQGISAVSNLTDRHHGLRLVIEVKNGFNPQAVLAALYRLTPMEESFAINSVCLVDGAPRTLNLHSMLTVFLKHKTDVVRRRSAYRLSKKQDRLHLVNGLLTAIADIDKVISIIRSSDDANTAKETLIQTFGLSQLQAEYILELRLRRLTKFSRIELETECNNLTEEIAYLQEILNNETKLKSLVRKELLEVSSKYADERKTVLLTQSPDSASTSASKAMPLEIADEPCQVVLSATGQIATIAGAQPLYKGHQRTSNDAIRSVVTTTTRSKIGIVTDDAIVHKIEVVDLVGLPRTDSPVNFAGGVKADQLIDTKAKIIGLLDLNDDKTPVVMCTKDGVIKRMRAQYPENKDEFSVLILDDDDKLVSIQKSDDDSQIAIVTTDAQILRLESGKIRPQGTVSKGVAGISLRNNHTVLSMNVISQEQISSAVVVTVALGSSDLLGNDQSSVKVTEFDLYPIKNRGGQGVRSHKFLKGEHQLQIAWVGSDPRALSADGSAVDLPVTDNKRDGSGIKLNTDIAYIGS